MFTGFRTSYIRQNWSNWASWLRCADSARNSRWPTRWQLSSPIAPIRLGASGYLLKSSASVELFTAIEQALAGKTYITPLVTKGMPLGVFLRDAVKPGMEKLTTRQREVLQLLAEGRVMKEVADLLHVTARTVAFHKYTIMEQLDLKTSAELVQYALEHGMLKKRD